MHHKSAIVVLVVLSYAILIAVLLASGLYLFSEAVNGTAEESLAAIPTLASLPEAAIHPPATVAFDSALPTATPTRALHSAVPPSPTQPALRPTITILPPRSTTAAVVAMTTLVGPAVLNGIALEDLIVLPLGVRRSIREIYAHGQVLGNNPHAFSKLGDSTIENPHFLTRFDSQGDYTLGDYAYLQPMIDYFAGSFARQGVAVVRGLHTYAVFDPMWADSQLCRADESVIACEFRLHNPGILFIRLGTNDLEAGDAFEANLRQIVEYCIAQGVIPLLGTKADRYEGPDNRNNTIVRQVAAEYNVPLWDYDLIAATLPGRGLASDGVHLTTFYPQDYTAPQALQRGYAVYNLLALIMLDNVWREVTNNTGT